MIQVGPIAAETSDSPVLTNSDAGGIQSDLNTPETNEASSDSDSSGETQITSNAPENDGTQPPDNLETNEASSDSYSSGETKLAPTTSESEVTQNNVATDKDSTYGTVVIAFDDGWDGVYTQAYPVLKHYNITATCFVNPANVGKSGYMTLDQLQELHDAGWLIANHGYNHVALGLVPKSTITSEIQNTINWLNANGFGDGAYFLASPYGSYNQDVLDVCNELGILTHRTTNDGYVSNPPTDLLQLQNLYISGDMDLSQAEAIINHVISTNTTVFILFHQIAETNPTSGSYYPYTWTTNNLNRLMAYISQIGVTTLTNKEWYNSVKNTVTRNYVPTSVSYLVTLPYHQIWYKVAYKKWYKYHGQLRYRWIFVKVKKWYKKYYRYHGILKYKWRYGKVQKWSFYWNYHTVVRWTTHWLLK